MIISAWRIFKPKHRDTAYTGDGARLFGGRWNSRGTSVVYTAQSVSLASLELLVHLDNHQILTKYLVAEVRFDDGLVTEISRDKLPRNWRESPPPDETQALGDAWANANLSAVLRVPSTVIETECNYLLNPNHPAFASIEIRDPTNFKFDERLAR